MMLINDALMLVRLFEISPVRIGVVNACMIHISPILYCRKGKSVDLDRSGSKSALLHFSCRENTVGISLNKQFNPNLNRTTSIQN